MSSASADALPTESGRSDVDETNVVVNEDDDEWEINGKAAEEGDDEGPGGTIELRPLVATSPDEDDSDGDEDEDVVAARRRHRRHPPIGATPPHGVSGTHGGEFGAPGSSTRAQVAVNIFISFVGAGMLGLPSAFAQSGYALGAFCLCAVSAGNLYAMLLLIAVRKKLESRGHNGIHGYGDVGRILYGEVGEKFVNVCLVISQVGFGTAYIIFIAANVRSVWAKANRAVLCFACVPGLAALVQVTDMKTLSPFSLLADVSNLLGISAVFFEDFEEYKYHHEPIIAADFGNFLYVTAVSIYSLEGIGMILPLESSAADREAFPSLLKKVMLGISMLMATFGAAGYVAYGSNTAAPVTLNLEGKWAVFVKLCLCLGLYLTYPVMLFPVNEVMEEMCSSSSLQGDAEGGRAHQGGRRPPRRLFRCGVVLTTAIVAYLVPDFGKFLSLVGSSICTLLGFVIPGAFHLKAFDAGTIKGELKRWEVGMDVFLMTFGVVFGILGTYRSFRKLIFENET